MKISVPLIEKFLRENRLEYTILGDAPKNEISNFGIDSRKISENEIFVAIKTDNRDGHAFVENARSRGAAATLVDVPVASKIPQIVVPAGALFALQKLALSWRKTLSGTVVGVTGSVGKTSTKDLLFSIFSRVARARKTFANLNNTLGVPMTILGADSEEKFLVVEAGMSVRGELAASAKMIFPDVALVTNVAAAHLEGLGNLENIAAEKAEIAKNLAPFGSAIFPAELLKFEAFASLKCALKIAARSASEAAFAEKILRERGNENFEILRCEISENSSGGFEIEIDSKNEKSRFRVPVASRGLAENSALAAIAAKICGVPEAEIFAALSEWKPSKNRGEIRVDSRERRFFVDCYNASPASILDSAAAFSREMKNSRNRLFVLGGVNELGNDSERLHFEVGEKLRLVPATDFLAVFGGNSRFYAEGAAKAAFPRERIFVFSEIEELRNFVEKFDGDIFVKGSRGFALERILPSEIS